MISGLRNDWESWATLEARNRRDFMHSMNFAFRLSPGCNLVEAEEKMMRDFGLCVEAFLNETARALGGDRDDLAFALISGTVQWRERDYGAIEARCGNTVVPVGFMRRVFDGETGDQFMERIRRQAEKQSP